MKKERSSGRLVLSDSKSVAAFSDKFIVKPKIVVEYLMHLDVVDFKKKRDMRIMLGTIYAKIQQKAPGSRAKQVPQTP